MTLRKLTSTREYLGDRAPITEAVINLRLADTQQPLIERLLQFAESLRDQYPKQFVQRQMSGELTIEPHKERTSMSSQHRTIGYALVSEDGRNVVRRGATASRSAGCGRTPRGSKFNETLPVVWRATRERSKLSSSNKSACGISTTSSSRRGRSRSTSGLVCGRFCRGPRC